MSKLLHGMYTVILYCCERVFLFARKNMVVLKESTRLTLNLWRKKLVDSLGSF